MLRSYRRDQGTSATHGHHAFNLSKRRDVPILLSVGYSSCHLCFC
ncbi:DUF255 domain-containing protein [Streptacidiphilus sp. N1-5]|uniref:DUF255 domain-containing protein n=1 Tax=Streptacidiphilus cavernicola TaxID=3342716 RepID=A0ABV6V1P2_9ACTN